MNRVIDAFGIACTVVLVLSFAVKGERRIRTVNLIGAVMMVAYGLITHTIGTWLSNAIIMGIQIFHLARGCKNV